MPAMVSPGAGLVQLDTLHQDSDAIFDRIFSAGDGNGISDDVRRHGDPEFASESSSRSVRAYSSDQDM